MPVASPVLQHLAMGIGFGGLGFLLVLGLRGADARRTLPLPDAPVDASGLSSGPTAVIAGPLPLPGDAAAPLDAPLAESPVAPTPGPPPPPPVFRVASLATDPTLTLTDGTVGPKPFLTALAAAGVSRGESYRILRAIAHVHDLNHTSPTDTFHVIKEKKTGHVVAFEYLTSPVDVFQAREEGGALTATKLDLHIETKRVATAVRVGSDLKASLAKAGLEEDLLQRLDDALDGHAELTDLHAGSLLRVIASEERLEGAFLRYAALEAVEYTPAPRGSTPIRVYRFPPLDPDRVLSALPSKGSAHGGSFYDAKGQEPFHGGWRIPVPTARIASRFNPHRMHPVLHVVMPHNGVDFAAAPGTPIYAAASGTVKTVGPSGPCGNMVQIEHTGGIISSYCHMSKFASGVHVGEHVETRQLIGYVGQTGRATGPHCHFAIKRNGLFIDPLAMKLDGLRVVPPSQRAAFDETRDGLDKALDAIVVDPPTPGTEPTEPEAPKHDAGVDGGLDDDLDETP